MHVCRTLEVKIFLRLRAEAVVDLPTRVVGIMSDLIGQCESSGLNRTSSRWRIM